MVAPPSIMEKLKLKEAQVQAEEIRKKLLAANKAKAAMLLLSVSASSPTSYYTKSVSDK